MRPVLSTTHPTCDPDGPDRRWHAHVSAVRARLNAQARRRTTHPEAPTPQPPAGNPTAPQVTAPRVTAPRVTAPGPAATDLVSVAWARWTRTGPADPAAPVTTTAPPQHGTPRTPVTAHAA